MMITMITRTTTISSKWKQCVLITMKSIMISTYEIELIDFGLHIGKQYEDNDNIESFAYEESESLINVEDEWNINNVIQTSTRNYWTSLWEKTGVLILIIVVNIDRRIMILSRLERMLFATIKPPTSKKRTSPLLSIMSKHLKETNSYK